jgi:hypothetical protein
MHFHSLIKQRYVRRWFSGVSNDGRNSITGLLVGLMTLTAGILANFCLPICLDVSDHFD